MKEQVAQSQDPRAALLKAALAELNAQRKACDKGGGRGKNQDR